MAVAPLHASVLLDAAKLTACTTTAAPLVKHYSTPRHNACKHTTYLLAQCIRHRTSTTGLFWAAVISQQSHATGMEYGIGAKIVL